MPLPRMPRPRPSLTVSVTVPSDGFWTRHHVGVRIDPGTLGVTAPVVVLTGSSDSTPSRLLADTIAHRFGARMIDAPPWPGGRTHGHPRRTASAELEEAARQAEFEAELAGIRAEIAAVDADHARIAARAARRRADTAEMVATGVLPEGFDEDV